MSDLNKSNILYMTHNTKIKLILEEYFDADFENDENMQEAVQKLADYVKTVTKSASTTVAKAVEKQPPSNRPYAQFVKLCSSYNKNEVTVDLNVTPGDHYRKKDTKSYVFFEENLQDMVGVEMSFNEMFKRVHAESNMVMRTAGICWGLLDKTAQQQVLECL